MNGLQCYGCAVLYTVNVEEEKIFIPEPQREKKKCKLQMTRRVKTHSFKKMPDSNSEIKQCWFISIFVRSLCGAQRSFGFTMRT